MEQIKALRGAVPQHVKMSEQATEAESAQSSEEENEPDKPPARNEAPNPPATTRSIVMTRLSSQKATKGILPFSEKFNSGRWCNPYSHPCTFDRC
jgi:hypothetical protein